MKYDDLSLMKCPEFGAPYDDCDIPDWCELAGCQITQTAVLDRPETVAPPK